MSIRMSREDRIRQILAEALQPVRLDVKDDSARHAGHAGAGAHGESHYDVDIVSPAFAGLSRVERHRRVNALLASEFSSGLHALSLHLKAPGE